jgi:hypothetical protein
VENHGSPGGSEVTSVWLVESGEYSDYRVDAIFTTEEQANEFVANGGGKSVIEYPLDTWGPEKAEYDFVFDLEGNVIKEQVRAYVECPCDADAVYHATHREHDGRKYVSDFGGIKIMVYRGPRDKALKIASERYTRLRAEFDAALALTERYKCADWQKYPDWRYQTAVHVAAIMAGVAPMPKRPASTFEERSLAVMGL